MSKYHIQVFPEKCTGCLRCQLGCSDVYTKTFNPSAAFIHVVVSAAECTIDFQENCNECGICVEHCFYGALEKTKREQEE